MRLIHKELCRQLSYNNSTGIFKWKISKDGTKAGTIAGYKNSDGYIIIGINKKSHKAHRLAWFYVHGHMPENMIDHIDKNPKHRHHNWITNLREASNQCNQRNRGNPKNNTSGVKGVSWDKYAEKWKTVIYVNNKEKYLGSHKDFDEAVCHRLAGEQCVNWVGCDSESPAYLYVKENIQ